MARRLGLVWDFLEDLFVGLLVDERRTVVAVSVDVTVMGGRTVVGSGRRKVVMEDVLEEVRLAGGAAGGDVECFPRGLGTGVGPVEGTVDGTEK